MQAVFPVLVTQYVVVEPGVTAIDELFCPLIIVGTSPTKLPVPHVYVELVPSVPPPAVNVVELPLQMVVVPEIDVGSVGGSSIVCLAVLEGVNPPEPVATQ